MKFLKMFLAVLLLLTGISCHEKKQEDSIADVQVQEIRLEDSKQVPESENVG